MEKRKKLFLRILCVLLCLGLLGVGAIALLNGIVIGTTRSRILSTDEAAKLEDVDCILVLGCHVRSGGVPSHMLEDRLTVGVQLYDLGAAPKLLMSGDHGQTEYDEVNTMKVPFLLHGFPRQKRTLHRLRPYDQVLRSHPALRFLHGSPS